MITNYKHSPSLVYLRSWLIYIATNDYKEDTNRLWKNAFTEKNNAANV